MSSVFQDNDYRCAIRAEARRKGRTFMDLARSTGIHTSYFSRVMKEKAHFSADQVYSILDAMGLDEEESEYVMMLREFDSSSSASRKSVLQKKIEDMQTERRSLANRLALPGLEGDTPEPSTPKAAPMERIGATSANQALSSEDYYFTTLPAKVHVALTIPPLRADRFLLAERLKISQRTLQECLEKLERLGLISNDAEGIRILKDDVHLNEDNPISNHNHIQWRLEALEKLRQPNKARRGTSFSVCFSSDPKTLEAIRECFKEFVVQVKDIVDKGGTGEAAYGLNFDLFQV
jgi:hypothetical protein